MLSEELFPQTCTRSFTRQRRVARGENGHWERHPMPQGRRHGMHGAGSDMILGVWDGWGRDLPAGHGAGGDGQHCLEKHDLEEQTGSLH